jgi:hypothetical protein
MVRLLCVELRLVKLRLNELSSECRVIFSKKKGVRLDCLVPFARILASCAIGDLLRKLESPLFTGEEVRSCLILDQYSE